MYLDIHSDLQKAALIAFPGMYSFGDFSKNLYADVAGERTFIGRTSTMVLVKDMLSAVVFAPCDALSASHPPTITLKWAGGPEYVLRPSWDDLPKERGEIAKALIEMLRLATLPALEALKKAQDDRLAPRLEEAEEAQALYDFFGISYRLEREEGVAPSQRWAFASRNSGRRTWAEDRAPVDGELAYVVNTHRDLSVRLVRLQHVPNYGITKRWHFDLIDLGPARFNTRGVLIVPEKDPPTSMALPLEGTIHARTEATDRMAHGMSTALHRERQAKSRQKAVTDAFGDILKRSAKAVEAAEKALSQARSDD